MSSNGKIEINTEIKEEVAEDMVVGDHITSSSRTTKGTKMSARLAKPQVTGPLNRRLQLMIHRLGQLFHTTQAQMLGT